MAMRLKDMLSRTVELNVKFDGDEIAVCYLPNIVTLDLTDRIDADAKEAEEDTKAGRETKHDWITSQLLPVIEWWDVLEDDGSRMEPTLENMRRMPVTFLSAVLSAIVTDQQVEPGEDDGSADG